MDGAEDGVHELLRGMGDAVLEVARTAIEAFETRDIATAERLRELDEPVDDYFKEFFKFLSGTKREEHSMEWLSTMILVCRYLERIADQAVDIGERVTYLVTGEFGELD